jgi:hypothetical protein
MMHPSCSERAHHNYGTFNDTKQWHIFNCFGSRYCNIQGWFADCTRRYNKNTSCQMEELGHHATLPLLQQEGGALFF